MDNYVMNKKTNRVTKIGSKAYKRHLLSKLRPNTQNNTVLHNVSYEDSQKLKGSLPKVETDKFYCYEASSRKIITKNKSIKTDEIIRYICNQLPLIIDKIIDGIDENATRDETKTKMIAIFHEALLNG